MPDALAALHQRLHELLAQFHVNVADWHNAIAMRIKAKRSFKDWRD